MILGPKETEGLVGYEVQKGRRDANNNLYDRLILRYEREFRILPNWKIPYIGVRHIDMYCIFSKMADDGKIRLFESNKEFDELHNMVRRYFTEEWAKLGVDLNNREKQDVRETSTSE